MPCSPWNPSQANSGTITTEGHIQQISDISLIQVTSCPPRLAYDGDDFFVDDLDTFPIKDGSSKIMKITRDGRLTTVAIDFTTVLGLAFDRKHRLYVLENTTGNPFPTPFTGRWSESTAKTRPPKSLRASSYRRQ